MTIQERLKSFRMQVSSGIDAFCEELLKNGCKITAPTIYGYEGGQRQPSVSYISGLIKVYDANPFWLLQGVGEMFVSEEDKSKANMPANVDLTNTVFIPVVNMDVSAGFGSLTEEIESTKDFVSFGKDWIKKHISANINNLVMFTVRGDSMDGGNSRIKNGSQIIVDTSVKEYINDGIYAIRIENALFVKRLQYMPGKLLVKSDNPIYQPFEVDLKTDSVNIIGAVVYVMNDILDRKKDALHPKKKNRPIASGKIQPVTGGGIACLLIVAAAVCLFILGSAKTAMTIMIYVMLNILYSYKLKQMVLVDVLVIAVGFILRVYAGAYAIGVPVSSFIFMTTLFLSLFLGFTKRKAELIRSLSLIHI